MAPAWPLPPPHRTLVQGGAFMIPGLLRSATSLIGERKAPPLPRCGPACPRTVWAPSLVVSMLMELMGGGTE